LGILVCEMQVIQHCDGYIGYVLRKYRYGGKVVLFVPSLYIRHLRRDEIDLYTFEHIYKVTLKYALTIIKNYETKKI